MGFGAVSGQTMEVIQGTAADLNATVVQATVARTVTNILGYGSLQADVQVQRHVPSDEMHGGQTTNTTPGTAVALGTAHCDAVVVKALTGNAGIAYVGDSGMAQNQFELNAKEAVSLGIAYLGSVFIDVDNSGEGVSWLIVK